MVRLEVTLRATDGTTLTPFDFEQTELTGVTSTSSTCTVPSDVALVGWTQTYEEVSSNYNLAKGFIMHFSDGT